MKPKALSCMKLTHSSRHAARKRASRDVLVPSTGLCLWRGWGKPLARFDPGWDRNLCGATSRRNFYSLRRHFHSVYPAGVVDARSHDDVPIVDAH
jgi:hypothetical protein